MVRMTKVAILINAKVADIQFHYRQGPVSGRLIIDSIDGEPYNMTPRAQKDALKYIDQLWEAYNS